MIYRIIVAGSRSFEDYETLKRVLDNYINSIKKENAVIEIIGGGANGADRFGEEYALMRGLPYRLFLPDWKKYKRGAGIVRNREMAQYSSEEIGVLFAFWDGKSKGTKNMIQTAKRLGLNVYVVDI